MPEDERMGVKSVRAAMMILIIGSGVVGFALAQVFAVEESGIISTKKKIEIPQGMEGEWEEFKERYGDAFTSVEWDFGCACVRELYGYYDTGRGELKSDADAEVLSKDFLTENAGLFKIDIGQLKFKKVDDWMVDYEQYYGDIPVYRGEVRVVMNGNAVIKDVLNDFHPDINISIEPKITKKEAVKIVLKQKNPGTTVNETGEVINGTRLYIVPKTEDGNIIYHLTWRVPTHTALYFINAEDSSVVLRVQTMFPSGSGTVSGGGIASAVSPLKYMVAVILLLTLIIIWRYRK